MYFRTLQSKFRPDGEDLPWHDELGKFFRANERLVDAQKKFDSKPKNYSKLNRAARIGGVLLGYAGIVAVKEAAFPIATSPTLGYQLLGITQIGFLVVGINKFPFADRRRAQVLENRKWKCSESLNRLNLGFRDQSVNSFFGALIDQNSAVFAPLANDNKFSKREKKRIVSAVQNIEDAMRWFSNGFYAGEISLSVLDDFKSRISELEEQCHKHGIDVYDNKNRIVKDIKKIRSDQVGEEPDFIDVEATERTRPFGLGRRPNGYGIESGLAKGLPPIERDF